MTNFGGGEGKKERQCWEGGGDKARRERWGDRERERIVGRKTGRERDEREEEQRKLREKRRKG